MKSSCKAAFGKQTIGYEWKFQALEDHTNGVKIVRLSSLSKSSFTMGDASSGSFTLIKQLKNAKLYL